MPPTPQKKSSLVQMWCVSRTIAALSCGLRSFFAVGDKDDPDQHIQRLLAWFGTNHISRIKDLKKIHMMQIFQTPYISFQYKQIIYFDFVFFFFRYSVFFLCLNRHNSVTLDRNARTCIKDQRKEPSLCIKLICFNDQRI